MSDSDRETLEQVRKRLCKRDSQGSLLMRCSECGKRVRGVNHEEGNHHKKIPMGHKVRHGR